MASSDRSDPYAASSDAASQRLITRTYYILTVLNTFAMGVVVSIHTLFMIDRGLSTFEWNLANAAYSIGMVVFEIPTGVVADTVGRRYSFLLSVVVLFVGTVGMVLFADDLVTFVGFNVLLGLGYTFASGALEAWVVDALKHHNFDGELSVIFARTGMLTSISMLAATTLGALMGSWQLELPYFLRALVLCPLAYFVLRHMFDDGYESRPVTLRTLIPEMNRTARNGFRYGLGQRRIRLLMLAAVFPSGFFLFGWYSWQPYLVQELGEITFGAEIVWLAGVISAVLMLATAVGNGLAPKLSRWFKRPSRLLASSAVVSGAALAVGGGIPALVTPGAASNFAVALAAFWVSMLMFGINTPVRQSMINESIAADERATVLSVDSLISNIGSSLGVIGLGFYAERVSAAGGLGIGFAWLAGAGIVVLSVPILWSIRDSKVEC